MNSIKQQWKGKTLSELEQQSYFQTLPHKDKEGKDDAIVRTYTRRGKFQTKAYCQSLGGCDGIDSGDCYHVFTIRKGIVRSYKQQGNCRSDNRLDRAKFDP